MSELLDYVEKKQAPSFPLHPSHPYNHHLASPINNFIHLYHNSQWINLEDIICFNQGEEYLKRFYQQQEYNNKIKLLGEYYRYHEEMPRIFIEEVERILEANVDDKRALEYDIVTSEMKAEQEMGSTRRNKKGECHKIIKDVELSYADFEKKNRKIVNEEQSESRKEGIENKCMETRGMRRVDSMTSKGAFLVLKPRNNNILNKEETKTNMLEPKYKKPNIHNKIQKEQHQKKENSTNNKIVSKITSNNNSLASNQGLSRSKSKAQLNTFKANNLPEKKQKVAEQKNLNKNVHKFSSNNNSKEKVLTKTTSRKNVLSDKKSSIHTLTRRPSKADLKHEEYYSTNQYSKTERQRVVKLEVEEKVKVQQEVEGRKCDKQSNEVTNKENGTKDKKMFSRVISIKKKV